MSYEIQLERYVPATASEANFSYCDWCGLNTEDMAGDEEVLEHRDFQNRGYCCMDCFNCGEAELMFHDENNNMYLGQDSEGNHLFDEPEECWDHRFYDFTYEYAGRRYDFSEIRGIGEDLADEISKESGRKVTLRPRTVEWSEIMKRFPI